MTFKNLRNASTLLRFSSPTSSLTTLLTVKIVRWPLSLSLANSIRPFPHLFSGTTSKNFSPIPAFSFYLPKVPITAASPNVKTLLLIPSAHLYLSHVAT